MSITIQSICCPLVLRLALNSMVKSARLSCFAAFTNAVDASGFLWTISPVSWRFSPLSSILFLAFSAPSSWLMMVWQRLAAQYCHFSDLLRFALVVFFWPRSLLGWIQHATKGHQERRRCLFASCLTPAIIWTPSDTLHRMTVFSWFSII